jgi:1-deoxy-D-xylulose-5-phosphate reductoisomerase
MMNKGLEVIEAHWLFDIPTSKIEVLVHQQSIVHSMVQFADGSIKAQLGIPDMRFPIHYALTYPNRLKSELPRMDFSRFNELNFEKPDMQKFVCLKLAYESLTKGGNMPCIMNAANEVAVQNFINGHIHFLDIPDIIGETMQKVKFINNPSVDDLYTSNAEAREIAEKIKKI